MKKSCATLARLSRIALVFLSLALAPAAHAQSAPPAALTPEETPPRQTDDVPPADQSATADRPPPAATPPPYAIPAYPPLPRARSLPTPEPRPVRAAGAEEHDGFYLRFDLGVGYTGMSASLNGTERAIAGTAIDFDLALGAAVSPHLVIYGAFIGSSVRSPQTTFSGQPLTTSTAAGMITATADIGGYGAAFVGGLGGGVAYYFDSNLFLAGSLLASRLVRDYEDGAPAARSDWGFTFEGLIGKEWWVSDNWGLGICGRLLLGAMKDQPIGSESVPTWKLAAFAALLSASYN